MFPSGSPAAPSSLQPLTLGSSFANIFNVSMSVSLRKIREQMVGKELGHQAKARGAATPRRRLPGGRGFLEEVSKRTRSSQSPGFLGFQKLLPSSSREHALGQELAAEGGKSQNEKRIEGR